MAPTERSTGMPTAVPSTPTAPFGWRDCYASDRSKARKPSEERVSPSSKTSMP